MTDSVSVAQILHQQLVQLNELESLLKDEHQVLQHHDPQKLLNVTHSKNDLLAKIETTDKSLAFNKEFIEGKESGQFHIQLKDIETVLLACKDLNKVNGDIIQKSQLSIERMRSSLLENHTKSSMTYDSKGKKSGGLSSKGITA